MRLAKSALKVSSTILSPAPTLMVSCRGVEPPYNKDNVISIAMAATLSTVPPLVGISIKQVRFSYQQIRESMEYVINLVGRDLVYEADWCGVKSGRDYDKFAECSLTPAPIPNLSIAPAIAESPLSIGCRVVDILKVGSYDLFVGEVVSVEADPAILNEKGLPDFQKAGLVSYNNGKYYDIGECRGNLGYSLKLKNTERLQA
ncbi:MAG: flavin reductase family protein [Deferribacteraceae bacterium]|jgi:flavin reductase (DIM6/NTAB) family NADH-FMN oxidoreductase RutF|nr:flavin reductase family protein [Deferribacteraceae bacterium]